MKTFDLKNTVTRDLAGLWANPLLARTLIPETFGAYGLECHVTAFLKGARVEVRISRTLAVHINVSYKEMRTPGTLDKIARRAAALKEAFSSLGHRARFRGWSADPENQ